MFRSYNHRSGKEMTEEQLDEVDLALIGALQIQPRATWSKLAMALGESPNSLARRWERISADGFAWISVHLRSSRSWPVALVEADLAPGASGTAHRALLREPQVLTVELMTYGRDLFLIVTGTDLDDVTRFVIDRLHAIPGLTRIRTHLVADMHVDASQWRLGSLAPTQVAALTDEASGSAATPTLDEIPQTHVDLIRALSADARASASQLAATVGRPESTVRRQLSALLRSGLLTFRCDIAHELTGWSVIVAWWLRVAERHRSEVVSALASDRRVRLCCSLAGPSNVFVNMWLRSPADTMEVRARLEAMPGVEVTDLAVVLRVPKRVGWLLDDAGRATGESVPVWPRDV